MLPSIWGKCAWNFLHLVSLSYPENPTEEDKKHYYDFFYSLQYILPCEKCQVNLRNHLKKTPLSDEILSSRTTLVRWLVDLHNMVNYYTGKPILSYKEALYEMNKLVNPPKKSSNIFFYLIIIVALLIILYMVYYFYQRE